MRRSVLLLALLLVVAACGDSGPEAEPVPGVSTVCIDGWCLDHPVDWQVEERAGGLWFNHPADDEESLLAVTAVIDMGRFVENVGSTWTGNTEVAVRSYWEILNRVDGELETVTEVGDAVRSEGTVEDGLRQWHIMIPDSSTESDRDAFAVVVRAPNETWAQHAEVFLGNVRPDAG